MTQIRRRPATLEDKLAYWIGHRTNVLFRCGPGVGIASDVTTAFDNSGLRWRALSAFDGEIEQVLSNEWVEAVVINGIDRVPKKVRRAILHTLGERPSQKIVWATVTVFDEDDFDLEAMDRLNVDGFDVVVEAPCEP